MRVVIAGGGNVGRFIAGDLLDAGHQVLIMEQEAVIVERAKGAAEPPDAEWMVADACELTYLVAAKLDTADVVVAATGDDEDKPVVSLLDKQELRVRRVVGLVHTP